MKIFAGVLLAALLTVAMSGCNLLSSFNAFQRRDEQVKQSWSQVLSVYQKRADLVPNLVNTVQGYAAHEASVFTKVAEARASVGKLQLPDSADPEALAKYAQAQKELSGALGRLLAVAESNPDLKANTNFLKLQDELHAIETQATAARNRYIREVAAYNIDVRSFPSNLVAGFFGYGVKPALKFDDENEIKRSPRVNFGKS